MVKAKNLSVALLGIISYSSYLIIYIHNMKQYYKGELIVYFQLVLALSFLLVSIISYLTQAGFMLSKSLRCKNKNCKDRAGIHFCAIIFLAISTVGLILLIFFIRVILCVTPDSDGYVDFLSGVDCHKPAKILWGDVGSVMSVVLAILHVFAFPYYAFYTIRVCC
jgi:hypothetical protein